MLAITAPDGFQIEHAGEISGTDDFASAMGSMLSSEALAVCMILGDLVIKANPGFLLLFGLDSARSERLRVSDLATESDRSWVHKMLAEAATRRSSPLQISFQARGPGGSTMDLELHAVRPPRARGDQVLAFLFEIRERRRHDEQLSFLAFLDAVTGLPNRALFFDRLRDTLVEARRSHRPFALMFADLDGFKAVNDALGHDAGDRVLAVVGDRLAACVRERDTVARQGGDEFAVLLPDLSNRADAERLAERMVQQVGEPIPFGHAEARVGISIGIALYPDHAADIDSLFSAADAAMYGSKRAGKNRYLLAEPATAVRPIGIEFISWSDSHAVGVEVIDRQHRELVDHVNRLGNALKNGHGRECLLAALGDLIAATRLHFETEERLMLEHGLTDQEIHCRHHRKLLGDVGSLGGDLDRRSTALTMRYLQEWLMRHIDRMDKPLGRALQEHGAR